MDPVSLLVAALVAGVGAGVTDAAASAVKDAYAAVKSGVARLLADKPAGQTALGELEASPKTWKAPLEETLRQAGAEPDRDLLDAAKKLLQLVDPAGSKAGKYVVNVSGGTVGAIGDNARFVQNIGTPPLTDPPSPG